MKKLYIFDCYGVVINEVGDDWLDRHHVSNDIYKKWRKIADEGDVGNIDENELSIKSGELINQKPEDFKNEWHKSVKKNLDVVQTIKGLRKSGAKVVMLSNTSSFVNDFLKKVDVDNIWDEKFFSYEIGIKKPDPRIFLYVLNKMKVEAKNACFIDDNEVNTKAAENLGIDSIIYPSKKFSEILQDL